MVVKHFLSLLNVSRHFIIRVNIEIEFLNLLYYIRSEVDLFPFIIRNSILAVGPWHQVSLEEAFVELSITVYYPAVTMTSAIFIVPHVMYEFLVPVYDQTSGKAICLILFELALQYLTTLLSHDQPPA